MAKYYSTTDALKMLPYIKAYCKDIKKYYERSLRMALRLIRLSELTTLDRVKAEKIDKLKLKIKNKLEVYNDRMDRWTNELKDLFIIVCDIPTGRVNIPVYLPSIEAVVFFCVLPETTEEDIEWHFEDETYEKARPFLELAPNE